MVLDLGKSFTLASGNSGAPAYAPEPYLVKDINPGRDDSAPNDLTDVNSISFFRADDWIQGAELWQSNGTADGTKLVKIIHPGS